MYPATSLLIALGRLGIVLLVGLSYPLQLLPCRACVYAFTSGIIKGKKAEPRLITEADEDEDEDECMSDDDDDDNDNDNEERRGSADSPTISGTRPTRPTRAPVVEQELQEEEEEEDDPLMPKRYVNDRGIGVGEMRRSKFLAFTTGILVAGFGIALVVDELEVGEF